MFTGIIRHSGRFRGFGRGKQELVVEAPSLSGRVGIGDSLAVDGVCLSVLRPEGPELVFNVSQETLSRTTLGALKAGAALNLELPLTLDAALGGHLMSGHVDFTGKIRRVIPRKPGRRLVLALPAAFRPYFVPKGSVALNGVSLTVAALGSSTFEVELIPVTLDKSNLTGLRAGDAVNVECDMVGKYVYNWASRTHR